MKSVLQFLGGAIAFILGQSGLLGMLPHTVQVILTGVGAVLGALGIRSASSAPRSLVDILNGMGSGWKTLVGVLVAVLGVALSPGVFNLLPATLAHVLTEVGTILGALGIYHANAAAAQLPPGK